MNYDILAISERSLCFYLRLMTTYQETGEIQYICSMLLSVEWVSSSILCLLVKTIIIIIIIVYN